MTLDGDRLMDVENCQVLGRSGDDPQLSAEFKVGYVSVVVATLATTLRGYVAYLLAIFLRILLLACLEEVLQVVVLLAVFLLLGASLAQAIPVRQAQHAFPVEVLPVEAFPLDAGEKNIGVGGRQPNYLTIATQSCARYVYCVHYKLHCGDKMAAILRRKTSSGSGIDVMLWTSGLDLPKTEFRCPIDVTIVATLVAKWSKVLLSQKTRLLMTTDDGEIGARILIGCTKAIKKVILKKVYPHLLGGVENRFAKTIPQYTRDSNLELPVIGSLGYYESSAIDHEVNSHLHGGRGENHLGKTTPVHPTEIQTSISPSSVFELYTTIALANYATEYYQHPKLNRTTGMFSPCPDDTVHH
uniref:(California timema) hypothetical protein n=1 Tax=Timema californicum TaxID=61474 RepID=A0A7R9IY76_TIMCA|nr:unnamed protein product [Timema californicum]